MSCDNQVADLSGVVIGLFQGDGDDFVLTDAAERFQLDIGGDCKLSNLIKLSGLAKSDNKEKSRLFYDLDTTYNVAAVVNLGAVDAGYNEQEYLEEKRENIRIGVADGVKHLKTLGLKTMAVDPCGDSEAAAEAAVMCVYEYKTKDEDPITFTRYNPFHTKEFDTAWDKGLLLGEAHNMSKELLETPANLLTPAMFVTFVKQKLATVENVDISDKDKEWAANEGMHSFLSVAQGSHVDPRFLVLEYTGSTQDPLVIVGKGICFDSGGISIKPSSGMEEMRADMGGAACTFVTIYALAKLGIPVHVVGVMPLTENMPGGSATKPGDVVVAMNGKSIQVDNTDAEGRLVLADGLVYAEKYYNPAAILDIATLTGAIGTSLGSAAAGAFTNSDILWTAMKKAGEYTGDRMWRMPLFKHYQDQMKPAPNANLSNMGYVGGEGGSCTAAGFLREFVEHKHWMHLDIACVSIGGAAAIPYMSTKMSGRPVRTVIRFVEELLNMKPAGKLLM